MHVPVVARRLFYRLAHRLLRIAWRFTHPSIVGVKCLLTHGDRILLVRHTYGHRAWDLPGGGVKRGERPLAAARREMREELDVEAASWTELGELRATVYHRRETVHCFSADLTSPTITMHDGELSAASWFPATALPSDLGPYVRTIVLRATDHPSG